MTGIEWMHVKPRNRDSSQEHEVKMAPSKILSIMGLEPRQNDERHMLVP
jgi:hypothetical protein